MKIDKKYIKMCEKAEEIQKIAPPPEEEGCFFYNPYLDEIMCRDGWNYCVVYDKNLDDGFSNGIYECETEDWHKDENIIWLPRQDQLQEMVNTEWHELGIILYLLIGFWQVNEKKFSSMEQLLLAFVMKRKYNKEWNDEKEEWGKIGGKK